MGIKDILGSISPLAGAITGKGILGKGFTALEDATGMGGLFPKLAAAARDKELKKAEGEDKAEAVAQNKARAAAVGAGNMKRGGAVKKMANGGSMKKMPSPADSVASGNRMSKMEGDEARFMGVGPKPKKKTMPSIREAVDSGNRMSRMEGAEMRKMKYAKGGSVSSRADGCAVRGKTKGRMV